MNGGGPGRLPPRHPHQKSAKVTQGGPAAGSITDPRIGLSCSKGEHRILTKYRKPVNTQDFGGECPPRQRWAIHQPSSEAKGDSRRAWMKT
jgi:hypothetical protein